VRAFIAAGAGCRASYFHHAQKLRPLARLALAQGLQEPDAAAVAIEAIDVVEDQGLMAVGVGFEVDAQGRSLATEPAGARAEGLADAAAFADAGRAEEEEQVQVSGGEGADVGIQLSVGAEAYGVRQHFGGCGHA
jgi:hypothetical protein